MSDRRTADKFDARKPVRVARLEHIGGKNYHPGEPLPFGEKGQLTADEAAHLWAQGAVVYEEDYRPTPRGEPVKPAKPANKSGSAKSGESDKGAGDPPAG